MTKLLLFAVLGVAATAMSACATKAKPAPAPTTMQNIGIAIPAAANVVYVEAND